MTTQVLHLKLKAKGLAFIAKPNVRTILSNSVLLSVLLLSLVLLFNAVCWGSANGLSQIISYKHNRWLGMYQVNQGPDESERSNLTYVVDSMLGLHPDQAHYLSLASSHYVWLSIFEPEKRNAHLNQAKSLLLESMVLRPTWPNTYINLAKIDGYLGNNPSQWLSQALTVGPHMMESHSAWVSMGFPQWDELTKEQKIVASSSLFKLASSDKGQYELNAVLNDLDRESKGMACRLLAIARHTMKSCEQ